MYSGNIRMLADKSWAGRHAPMPAAVVETVVKTPCRLVRIIQSYEPRAIIFAGRSACPTGTANAGSTATAESSSSDLGFLAGCRKTVNGGRGREERVGDMARRSALDTTCRHARTEVGCRGGGDGWRGMSARPPGALDPSVRSGEWTCISGRRPPCCRDAQLRRTVGGPAPGRCDRTAGP